MAIKSIAEWWKVFDQVKPDLGEYKGRSTLLTHAVEMVLELSKKERTDAVALDLHWWMQKLVFHMPNNKALPSQLKSWNNLCELCSGIYVFSDTATKGNGMFTTYVNLTPHIVRLNDGRVFLPTGKVARVNIGYHVPAWKHQHNVPVFVTDDGADIIDLPDPVEGTCYIVSLVVLQFSHRADILAPATGHPKVIRDENGQIYSVPGLCR